MQLDKLIDCRFSERAGGKMRNRYRGQLQDSWQSLCSVRAKVEMKMSDGTRQTMDFSSPRMEVGWDAMGWDAKEEVVGWAVTQLQILVFAGLGGRAHGNAVAGDDSAATRPKIPRTSSGTRGFGVGIVSSAVMN